MQECERGLVDCDWGWAFVVEMQRKTYTLCARREDTRREWVRALSAVVVKEREFGGSRQSWQLTQVIVSHSLSLLPPKAAPVLPIEYDEEPAPETEQDSSGSESATIFRDLSNHPPSPPSKKLPCYSLDPENEPEEELRPIHNGFPGRLHRLQP